MLDTFERWGPMTAATFWQYRLGVHPSADALFVVKRMIAREAGDQAKSRMTKQEWTELMGTLGRAT